MTKRRAILLALLLIALVILAIAISLDVMVTKSINDYYFPKGS